MRTIATLALLTLALSTPVADAASAATTVVATGLQAPSKMTAGPGGGVIVAESGTGPNTGGVSWVSGNGLVRKLVTGLPSGPFEAGAPSGPTAVVVEGSSTLLVLIGIGNGTVPGTVPGTQVPNPTGGASPVLASILELRFSRPLNKVAEPFALAAGDHVALAFGVPVKLHNASGTLRLSLLTNLPDYLPRARQGGVRNANPYGMDRIGDTLFVADAGQDGVWRVNRTTGRASIAALFPALANPTPIGPPVTDFVPTSVRALTPNSFLVGNLSGFPFATGNAAVWRVGPGSAERVFDHLTTVTDVLPVKRSGHGTRYYVLEFSTAFLATPQGRGRLLRFSSLAGAPEILADDLISPTGLVVDPDGRGVWVSEFFTGRIVRVE